MSRNEYEPDYVSPPYETVVETLEALDMGIEGFCLKTGRPIEEATALLSGEARIDSRWASALWEATGVPRSFWISRQARYDAFIAARAGGGEGGEDA